MSTKDPTRTLTIRRQAFQDINVRYREVKSLINESVVQNDALAIKNVEALSPEAFRYQTDANKVLSFDMWLNEVLQQEILTQPYPQTNTEALMSQWLVAYVVTSYASGAIRGNNDIARVLGRDIVPQFRPLFLSLSPHIEASQILYNKTFTDLVGVTDTMSTQISRILSEGLLSGDSPLTVAKNINNRVDKIGITRSRLIARTEIALASNIAAVEEGKRLVEVIGQNVVYRWQTAGDELVRATHRARNGKYYTSNSVVPLLGEPNCRCGVIATPIDQVPKGTKIR